ncbi:hypothetical protein AGMMS49983_13850 [Clostridia bacterium]|nr:hypothetical protein AGMMS49983_13850 [Clostridia bacterium]
MKNRGFVVRKSKISIIVGFSIVEPVLSAILVFLIYMWFDTKDDPILRESINFPFALFTLIIIAVFFHFVLLMGLCGKFIVNGDDVELHRFLRRTKTFRFTDIKELRDVTVTKWSRLRHYGVRDFKIVSHGNKCLGYLQSSDRNFDLFVRTFHRNGVK